VAYGYYWSQATPVLRIASGDIIDVDTLLTNTPAGLAKAGVPEAQIQPSLKAIVAEVTGERRGPGGHILTGPVYVEGAEPGDVLEVKILSINLAIDYGYNGCSGVLPESRCGSSRSTEPRCALRSHRASWCRCALSSAAWESRRRPKPAA